MIFSRVFPLFFAPVGFPEDLSGDVRGRTGAALKSDHGQSALGRPFPVIVDNFSIKCRRGGPSNAIKPYICFRYRFPPVLPRTSPDKSSGNPTGAKNSGKTREKINGRTTEQTEDRPGRLSASGPVFYPFYNRLIYRSTSSPLHIPSGRCNRTSRRGPCRVPNNRSDPDRESYRFHLPVPAMSRADPT